MDDKMTLEEFRKDIMNNISDRPDFIRYGQSVFNYIDEKYGVARKAQFDFGVDCFYNDHIVDAFIKLCYDLITGEK